MRWTPSHAGNGYLARVGCCPEARPGAVSTLLFDPVDRVLKAAHTMRRSQPYTLCAAVLAVLWIACGGGEGGVGPNQSPPPPAPPPPPPPPGAAPAAGNWAPPSGNILCSDDFTSFADWAAFVTNTTCITNVSELPTRDRMDIEGKGLRYRYKALPGRCGDQFVGVPARINLPKGLHEVWIQWTGIFSANWTNLNAGCQSPAPDFKYILVWSQKNKVACGGSRADFKMGQGSNEGNIHASTIGFPACDEVPVGDDGTTGTVREPGAAAFFDGQPHVYRLSFKILGDGFYEVFAAIDDRITHQYVTKSVQDATLRWDKIVLGANRNLGAIEDMQLWWKDLTVWAR